jgi:1,2-dihydroxy-3-keto-5-methylthiopentene dioxygenase
VPNDQDMTRWRGVVERALGNIPPRTRSARASRSLHLGRDDRGAERHVEILEFLFETIGRIEGSIAMALIRIPVEDRTITDPAQIAAFLATQGSTTNAPSRRRRSAPTRRPRVLLEAYKTKIDELKARGGYVTADVIDVFPDTPNSRRCSTSSTPSTGTTKTKSASSSRPRAVSHSCRKRRRCFAIEVEAGDLIRVPRGTHHWFDLCVDRRIRAIRLFQDASGWTPHYTQSGVDKSFQPVCFGPRYFPPVDLGV